MHTLSSVSFLLRLPSVLLLSLLVLAVAAPGASATTLFGITSNGTLRIVSFDADEPETLLTVENVTGLGAGETILGMDYRPQTGDMVLVTRDGSSVGRVRTIQPYTGVVGAPITMVAAPGDMSSPYGSLPGPGDAEIDINPVTDRIRYISASGLNISIDPTNGHVTTDGNIMWAPGDPNAATSTATVAVAHMDNNVGSLLSQMLTYTFNAQVVTTIANPANGQLSTIGPSGVTASPAESVAMDVSGPSGAQELYLTASVSITPRLYTINGNGSLNLVGDIDGGSTSLDEFSGRPNVVGARTDETFGVEGSGVPARVVLDRSGMNAVSVVNWTVTPGTASSADVTTSGTATFPDGDSQTTLEIPITNDSTDEAAETFTVTLTPGASPANGSVLVRPAASTVTVTIADDDVAPAAQPPAPPAPSPAPATPAPAAMDTTQPLLFALVGKTLKRAAFTRSGLPVTFSTSEAGTGVAELRLGTKLVGSVNVSAAGTRIVTTRVRPSAAGKRLIAAARGARVKLALTIRLTDAAGNTGTYKSAVSLTR